MRKALETNNPLLTPYYQNDYVSQPLVHEDKYFLPEHEFLD